MRQITTFFLGIIGRLTSLVKAVSTSESSPQARSLEASVSKAPFQQQEAEESLEEKAFLVELDQIRQLFTQLDFQRVIIAFQTILREYLVYQFLGEWQRLEEHLLSDGDGDDFEAIAVVKRVEVVLILQQLKRQGVMPAKEADRLGWAAFWFASLWVQEVIRCGVRGRTTFELITYGNWLEEVGESERMQRFVGAILAASRGAVERVVEEMKKRWQFLGDFAKVLGDEELLGKAGFMGQGAPVDNDKLKKILRSSMSRNAKLAALIIELLGSTGIGKRNKALEISEHEFARYLSMSDRHVWRLGEGKRDAEFRDVIKMSPVRGRYTRFELNEETLERWL